MIVVGKHEFDLDVFGCVWGRIWQRLEVLGPVRHLFDLGKGLGLGRATWGTKSIGCVFGRVFHLGIKIASENEENESAFTVSCCNKLRSNSNELKTQTGTQQLFEG